VSAESDGLGYASRLTGKLNHPRWYSSGVLLPDGSVMAFSGADRDAVVSPGFEFPVLQAERFDPASVRWTPLAAASRPRTYHNTAMLLPDGRVLVGGHAPINTAFLTNLDLPGGFAPNHRDPSFEIYSPPYVFRSDRPKLTSAPAQVGPGQTFTIATPQGLAISKVLLIRRSAVTHLVDGDQRAVSLKVVSRKAGSVTVRMPSSPAVAPAGPYLLFLQRATPSGVVPSLSKPVTVLGADPVCAGGS
jgi:hypothetical protein